MGSWLPLQKGPSTVRKPLLLLATFAVFALPPTVAGTAAAAPAATAGTQTVSMQGSASIMYSRDDPERAHPARSATLGRPLSGPRCDGPHRPGHTDCGKSGNARPCPAVVTSSCSATARDFTIGVTALDCSSANSTVAAGRRHRTSNPARVPNSIGAVFS